MNQQNWEGFRDKDGQVKTTDCKRAILASLSKNIKSTPLFKVRWYTILHSTYPYGLVLQRATQKYWWQLGQYNPLFTEELNEGVTKLELEDEPLNGAINENKNGRTKTRPKDNGVLTELQGK